MFKKTLCALVSSLFFLSSSSSAVGYDKPIVPPQVAAKVISASQRLAVTFPKDEEDKTTTSTSSEVEYSTQVGTSLFLCDRQTSRRYLLTADHVLPEKSPVYYVHLGGIGMSGLKRDSKIDLAILTTTNFSHDCYQGKIDVQHSIGDLVFFAGYMGEDEAQFRSGMISRIYENLGFSFNGDVYGGDSGSGVFALDHGNPTLIGLIVRKKRDKAISYVLSGKNLCAFLKDTPVEDDYCGGEK